MRLIVPVSQFLFHTEQGVELVAPLGDLHSQIKDILHMMLVDTDADPSETNPG
jgi:hypothetical protein